MPELPEVENIRIQLDKYIVGHKIEGVEIKYSKCFSGDKNNLLGGKVTRIRRFGKALSIDLDNDYSILIHIKMTGQLIYRGLNLKNPPEVSNEVKGGLTGKHNHVTFYLDRSGKLYYVDYRKFGWMKVVKTKMVEENDFVKNLGPEFLDGLTIGIFRKIVGSSSRPIKALLMDQNKLAGVGNIYANDALFLAKIHPERKSSSLSLNEQKDLFDAVEEVLKRGIKCGGASEISFVTPDGATGSYQDHSLIYGKGGEKCPNGCDALIEKSKVGGRGTYFCPKCQTLK